VVVALGGVLLIADGMTLSLRRARTGEEALRVELGATGGAVRQVRASADRTTIAVLSTADGGRLDVLRHNERIASWPIEGEAIDLSPDGDHVAVTSRNQLALFSVPSGVSWVLAGDDRLRRPRFSHAGDPRLAVGSDLGTLYVLHASGEALLRRDLQALPVPAWLGDGTLLVGTWQGRVSRLDEDFAELWTTHLAPAATDVRPRLLEDSTAPLSRIPWSGNAAATAAPLQPNLLSARNVRITFDGSHPDANGIRDNPIDGNTGALTDGQSHPPPTPWLRWLRVEVSAEQSLQNHLVLDLTPIKLLVRGITLAEDPDHPESWLRDLLLEYWDDAQSAWLPNRSLLSDAAVHTHWLTTPIEASKLRLAFPYGVVTNLRLVEVVLHGETLA
jgi:hypothetical protein